VETSAFPFCLGTTALCAGNPSPRNEGERYSALPHDCPFALGDCIRPAWSMSSCARCHGRKQKKKIRATLSLPGIDAPAELFNVQAIDHPSRRHRKARITVAIMKIQGCTRRRFDFLAAVSGGYFPSFRGFYRGSPFASLKRINRVGHKYAGKHRVTTLQIEFSISQMRGPLPLFPVRAAFGIRFPRSRRKEWARGMVLATRFGEFFNQKLVTSGG